MFFSRTCVEILRSFARPAFTAALPVGYCSWGPRVLSAKLTARDDASHFLDRVTSSNHPCGSHLDLLWVFLERRVCAWVATLFTHSCRAIAFVLVLVRISGSDSVASGDCEKCYTLVGRLIGILGSETVASGDFVQCYTRVGRNQLIESDERPLSARSQLESLFVFVVEFLSSACSVGRS